jgi:hypothetical protein
LRRHDERRRESAKCSQISHHRDQNKHKQGPTDRRRYRGEHRPKREREKISERARELAGCVAKANNERLCFAREGTEGSEGEEDKREREISIAKKIYFNFKGLKLCDFGDLQ